MYELFILGELMDQPMHGYLLREIINLAIGPTRQMSWGALYPLLARLEEEGLIAQVASADAGEPAPARGETTGTRQRKIYGITPAGRERFAFLMTRPQEYTHDYPDIFQVQLANFDHLTPEQRMEVLLSYRGYARFLVDQFTRARRFVQGEPRIDEGDRVWILRTIDHRLHLATADLEWIEQEIAGKEQR